LTGCAGRSPNPVPQYQPQDDQMSCAAIKQEINDNQTKITNLIPKENKTGKNVALGVAGAFLLVPWFFMDFSDAEQQEVQAYQLRNSHLRTLYEHKKCTDELPPEIKFEEKPAAAKTSNAAAPAK
jgi:UTP-glucose-1-phosphate uridylyltransferase